jgi:uncharacterized damage-inducible protein DinB
MKLIETLDETDLTNIPIEGSWTIKDLMGHIAAWENSLIVPLESFILGDDFRPEIIPDHDAWNAHQAKARQGLSCMQIQQEMLAIRSKLVAVARQLTKEQLTQVFPAPWGDEQTIPDMISGIAWHEEEHTKSILRRLGQK